ncbi:MAG: DNA primase [Planctomycetota bacterium]
MHNSIKDKILQSSDIVEVIAEHVSLSRRGKEYIGLCPFHPDHKPSMYVSPKKQIFKCFACGAGGDAIKFIQLRQRVTFREALAILAQRAGIDQHVTDADRRSDQQRDQIRQVLTWARDQFRLNLRKTSAGRAALDYALGRGLTEESMERHGLGYADNNWDTLLQAGHRAGLQPDILQQAGLITTNEEGRTYDRFRNRLIFPINDGLGRIVAFGGRALGDDPAKYLNSPETSLFSKSRILYGLDLARGEIEKQGLATIVEGYTDAVMLHQYGFRNVVATLGTALTDAHVKLIRPLAEKLTLCFDGDQAGMRAADRAVEVSLLGGMEVHVVVLESGSDPADCVQQQGAAGFENILKQAVHALEFKWRLTKDQFAGAGPRGRRTAIESLLDFIAGVTVAGSIDPLEQGLLVRYLSELLALTPVELNGMLASSIQRVRRSRPAATEDIPEQSDYESAIHNLPHGMIVAVEELFGLLLADWRCTEHIDDNLVRALDSCEAWRSLYNVVQNLLEEVGEYQQAGIIARCERADVCELVSQACQRTRGTKPAMIFDVFCEAQKSLAAELNVLQTEKAWQETKNKDTADCSEQDHQYKAFLQQVRSQHKTLPDLRV